MKKVGAVRSQSTIRNPFPMCGVATTTASRPSFRTMRS